MALMTTDEAGARVTGLCEDAMRALDRKAWPAARDFLEEARAQTAAIIAKPVTARKVPRPADPDRRFSSSLQFGLAILALFPMPANGEMLGIVEVATLLNESRSTVHRYMSTLVLEGQLEQTIGRKYRRPQITP